jgi:hypothetical protein
MTPLDALLELLERVGATQGTSVLVSDEELSDWPVTAVKAMQSQKLLAKARPAASVVCPGCEQECIMPVHSQSSGSRGASLFIACDKRDDINRVAVSAERLKQWQCSTEAVCAFVAQSLGLRPYGHRRTIAGVWELGLVAGKKRSQMLCIRANGELKLIAGNNDVPLADLVRREAGTYAVDIARIRQLVDAAGTADSRYTPSIARREARKLDTQALHESWQREFHALNKRHSGMSDVWYSRQIGELDSARGRSAETIRKHMKK